VTAVLEVPTDRWAAVHPRLDDLLASEPKVRLHVTLPAARQE
jgi:hypothetical protein